MTEAQLEAAQRGLQEVSIISSIILRLANSAIRGDGTIDGPELQWLAEQLDRASIAAKEAMEGENQPD